MAKLWILGGLYTVQYLPIAFFHQTLPAFMRQQGASLETIGALGFLALPWVLKSLWSPWIDRFSPNRRRHYTAWVFCFQLLLAVCLAGCGFLDINKNFPALMALTLVACICSASQDIATDALAVKLLTPTERPWGSTLQSAGNYFGAVLGGGGVSILLDRLGWRMSLLSIAAVMLVAGLSILGYAEVNREESLPSRDGYLTIVDFFRRRGMVAWTAMLLIYLAGTSMASGMMRPLLVDRQFSLTAIGEIVGVVSYSAGIVGAIAGGAIVSRWGIRRAIVGFTLVQGLSLLLCLGVN
jgi:MFS transporter, PAT family, beta-lactamase induction signal transducer AmpG